MDFRVANRSALDLTFLGVTCNVDANIRVYGVQNNELNERVGVRLIIPIQATDEYIIYAMKAFCTRGSAGRIKIAEYKPK